MEAGLVIVGASLAGVRVAETARRSGYAAPIVLIGAESHLPYDRPPLSKEFLAGADAPTFPTAPTLADQGIELRLGSAATALSLDDREVTLADGTQVPFDSLVIATGCSAIRLPGAEQVDGVHTLRTLDDAEIVRRHVAAGSRTVIVGGGFIGAEVASALRKQDADVTIVEAAPVPLVRAVGEQLAQEFVALHARNGVDVRCGTTVSGITEDGNAKKVELSDGTVLVADLVLVGIGARPATEWLADAGLTVGDGVVCDQTLAAAPGVYAAGDVARWHNALFDTSMRLEHWTAAAEQAAAVGRNVVAPDEAQPFATVPYFWSDWYGQRIQMVGIAACDEATVLPDRTDDSWLALYRSGDRLVGALALNRPSRIMKYRAMITRRTTWADALDFARAS